jgi:hypothetical protein
MKFLTVEAAANYKIADIKADMHCKHAAKLNSNFQQLKWMPQANWGEIYTAVQDATLEFRNHTHRFSVFVFDDTADSVWWQLKQKKSAKFTCFEVDDADLLTLVNTLSAATVGYKLAYKCWHEILGTSSAISRLKTKASKANLGEELNKIVDRIQNAGYDSDTWMHQCIATYQQVTGKSW